MKASGSRRGFSLIEIVVVLGVVSISIVAIMGLLSLGINSGKSALNGSLISAMSRQIISSIRQQPFASNDLITSFAAGSSKVCFFDANGNRLTKDGKDLDPTSALAAKAIYQCTITGRADVQQLGPAPAGTATLPYLLDLSLNFQWPLQAQKPNSHTLQTSIARYY